MTMNPLRYFFEEKPVDDSPAPVAHPSGPPGPFVADKAASLAMQHAMSPAAPMMAAGPIEDDFSAILTAFEAILPFAAPVLERARWFSHLAAPVFRTALAAAGYKVVRV